MISSRYTSVDTAESESQPLERSHFLAISDRSSRPIMADSQSQPGILLLASRNIDDSAALTGLELARWSEETCIPSVQATGGISHTLRYESLTFMKQQRSSGRGGLETEDHQLENINYPYDFLDIYFMPDSSAKDSEAFRQLPIVGDSEITADVDASKLLERLLMLTEFDVRFCAAADPQPSSSTPVAPAPFLITVALETGQTLPDNFAKAGKIMGRYRVQEGSTLSALERQQPPSGSPGEIVLLSCNSVRRYIGPVGNERADSMRVGIWGLRRAFTGNERQPAAWRPGVRI